eukprot:9213029-Ditylum_brightwellii.AAC.2
MNNAERYMRTEDNNYGGRKGCTAIDPVGITTFTREIFICNGPNHVSLIVMQQPAMIILYQDLHP